MIMNLTSPFSAPSMIGLRYMVPRHRMTFIARQLAFSSPKTFVANRVWCSFSWSVTSKWAEQWRTV